MIYEVSAYNCIKFMFSKEFDNEKEARGLFELIIQNPVVELAEIHSINEAKRELIQRYEYQY